MENHKMTQPWTGNKAGDVQGLPLAPNTPYWLMHHPETCWEFIQHDKQWMFLPTFRRLWELPGCNGVRMLPRGGGCDSQLARITMMDNGFQILDMELGYQQRYKTRGGGWFYVDIWSTPKILGKKVIWKFDKESFNKWRLELLDEGFIPQLDEDVLSILISTKTKRVERNAMRTHIPAIKKNYDEESIVLDLMRQYKKTGGPIPIKEEKKRMKKSV
jgi:hypothetical protein